jgi:ABC-type bacteriocin/lantibiotic exporter with double-glycine peptidase domain
MDFKSAINRISQLTKIHKREVLGIYLFSAFSGLVQLSLPLGVQAIVGFVLGATMVTSIYVLIFLVVLGVLIVGLLQINQMRLVEKVQQQIFTDYAFEFVTKIPRFDLKKWDSFYLPEKVNHFFETVTVQKSFSKILLDLPMATIQIVLGLLLLSFYHPFFIVWGVIQVVVIWWILLNTSKPGLTTSLTESKYKYAVASWFGEMARTLKSIKFSEPDLAINKTDLQVMGYLDARTKHFKVLLFQYKILVFFKVCMTFAMLTIGVVLLVNQQLNVGEFIAVEIVIIMVINAVEKLIISLESFYDLATGLEKLAIITESPLEKNENLTLNSLFNGIQINFIDFTFEFEIKTPLLKHVSLAIEKGSKIGIHGSQGSGKSIFLRMLTGNYTDFVGSLLINQIPIQNLNKGEYRRQVGTFLQGHEIFMGTLWENITLGQTDISADMIIQQANKLGFLNLLQYFPMGFDTILDPMGKKLSESLKKKILLTRATIGKKSLLLLEEPWNGLSNELQVKMKHYFLNELPNVTVIIATNDADYIQKCGEAFEIKNGVIVN